MSRFEIGDLVLVRENAPIDGVDEVFTHVMSKVLEIKDNTLILGIHDRTQEVEEQYCDKCTKYKMENRVNAFTDVLHRFLEFFGAKIYGGKSGSIVVTLDEGDSFYKIRPNHERLDKDTCERQ